MKDAAGRADRASRRRVVAAAAVFLYARAVVLVASHQPTVYYDSAEWRDMSVDRSFEAVSLLGNASRPPLVPLFYALLPNDGARVVAQALVSTAAWLMLAFAVRSVVRHRALQFAGFVVVLLFGASSGVTNWDVAILSESITLSLAAAALAAWLRRSVRPTGLNAAAATLCTAGLLLTRMQLLPVVVGLVVVLGGSALRSGRHLTSRRSSMVAAAMAASLAVVVVWAIAIRVNNEQASARRPEGIGTFGQNFVMVLRNRVIWDPAIEEWFLAEGMPNPEGILRPSPEDGGVQAAYDAYRGNGALVAWTESRALTTMLKYSFLHPDRFPRRFVEELPDMVAPPKGEVTYVDVPVVVLEPLDAFLSPSKDSLGAWPPYLVLAVCGVGAIALPRRRPVTRGPLLVLAMGIVTALVSLYLGWLVSPMEMARHAVPFGLMTRLIPAVIVVLLADRAFVDAADGTTATAAGA